MDPFLATLRADYPMPADKETLGKLEVHETVTGPEADVNTVVVHFQVQLHEPGRGGINETQITALISEF